MYIALGTSTEKKKIFDDILLLEKVWKMNTDV